MTWNFDSGDTHITGTTTFNVDSNGGALAYTSSDSVNHNVLYGTITPGSYQKIGPHGGLLRHDRRRKQRRLPGQPDRRELLHRQDR